MAAGVVALRGRRLRCCAQRDAGRMLRWLEGLGAEGLEKLAVKNGPKGLGVFAVEDLKEGEVVT